MRLAILVLEDEPEVRESLERDLFPFAGDVRIEMAEDVDDAWEVVSEIDDDGDLLALVLCDHRLPGRTGVDFLVEMFDDERTASARKVLVTGQADQADTIRAVNQADLARYIAKPWDGDHLREVVREQLTMFVVNEGIDPLPHLGALDGAVALEALRSRAD